LEGKRGVEKKGGKVGEKNTFLNIYTKFFGGKIFTATRVVSSKHSQFTRKRLRA
jgi:hypothetical protein